MLIRLNTPSHLRQAIVVAVVFVGFALQQLFVPLHLVWNDHVYARALSSHAHSHLAVVHGDDGHWHDEEHSDPHGPSETGESGKPGDPGDSDDSGSDHHSHPVTDHLNQLAEPAVPPTRTLATIAPAFQGSWVLVLEPASLLATKHAESVPRPPPTRSSAGPRAPPVVS